MQAWHYRASVGPRAATVDVQLCFTGEPSALLVPGTEEAADYVEEVRHVGHDRSLSRVRGGSFSLEGVDAGDCVAYRIDLARMGQREGMSQRVRWIGDSVIVRQTMWLWRPHVLPDDIDITMELALAEGIEASVPWALVEGSRGDREAKYRLDPTVFSWLGYNAFGDLDLQRFETGGTKVEVALLDADMACSRAGIRAWAEDAVACSSALFGEYPREHLQMLVVPIDGGGGSVYFGMAGRGGGAGVYILMDTDASDGELVGGWTTVHELLHHGMPFIEDPWMGEGFVTYYTEVMRTRQGHRTELEGWSEMWRGFQRGKREREAATLQEFSDDMGRTHAFQRVYWGGAAIALLADVRLRIDSGGKRSLDDAMREIRRCCGDAREKVEALELMGELDRWYGKPIFTEIAEQALASEGFPDVEKALGELGIRIVEGKVVLDDDHPAARHRRGIMAPR